jgi:prepilin-type N-terminal cleavage/methylation domain-containing protein
MTLVSSRSLLFKWPTRQAGFSLVEVIITIAIISILTALIMFRYGSFNSAVLLKNQAYEIALAIREAQISAVSARNDVDSSSDFRGAFGFFAHNDPTSDQQYSIWRDNPPSFNQRYDSGEEIATVNIDNRFRIAGICGAVVVDCKAPGFLSIAFVRPNFDAVSYLNGVSENLIVIQLEPVDNPGIYRQVIVSQTGQISVE